MSSVNEKLIEVVNKYVYNVKIRSWIRKVLAIGYTEEEFDIRCKESEQRIRSYHKSQSTGWVELVYNDGRSPNTLFWPEYTSKREFTDSAVATVIFAGKYTSGKTYKELLRYLPKDMVVRVYNKNYTVAERLKPIGESVNSYECVVVENWNEHE